MHIVRCDNSEDSLEMKRESIRAKNEMMQMHKRKRLQITRRTKAF